MDERKERHQDMEMRVACCTLGCKVNQYESQTVLDRFAEHGYRIVDFSDFADVYIINTCTVTQIAARKSRQMIHRARKHNPNAVIAAMGCYIHKDERQILDGIVDVAVGNRDKMNILSLVEDCQRQRGLRVPGTPEASENRRGPRRGPGREQTRAFLKVQDGCRQYCSYCIIPYVRGPLASKEPYQAVAEARDFAEAGYKEIVLTGIHLSSYGKDLEKPSALAELIGLLGQIEGLHRIRLGSLEPRMITQSFLDSVGGTRTLCPHFHLSLQSGSAATLSQMNRKYTPDEYGKAVDLLRATYADAAVTTDVIVGFPGETEAEFLASADFVRTIGFAHVHVFKYSRMEGTKAAERPDQIPEEEKQRRSEEMLRIADEGSRHYLTKYIGAVKEVLVEEYHVDGKYWEGYTDNYIKVRIPAEDGYDWRNQLLHIKLESMDVRQHDYYMWGVTV